MVCTISKFNTVGHTGGYNYIVAMFDCFMLEATMKILYLIPKPRYTKKMSCVRRHALGAVKRYPGVNLKISGPGWEGFDSADNVEKRFKPDLVWWYKPFDIPGYKNVKAPKCLSYNEMWDKVWTVNEIRGSKSGLVICHHHNDIEKYKGILEPNKFKLVHNPHCGEIKIFKDYGLTKDIDVLFVGINSKKVYPLRNKLLKKVQPLIQEAGFNFQRFKHPGYRLKSYKEVQKHTIKYAMAINRAKIAVTCSSVYRYALAKYAEIPLCKTALCADMPHENMDWYDKWMIQIGPESKPRVIADKIISYLKDKDSLEKITQRGYEENLKHRTQEGYAERFVKIVKEYLNCI